MSSTATVQGATRLSEYTLTRLDADDVCDAMLQAELRRPRDVRRPPPLVVAYSMGGIQRQTLWPRPDVDLHIEESLVLVADERKYASFVTDRSIATRGR